MLRFALLISLILTVVAQAKPPNLIVIVADDLGYADIGAQGRSKDVRTPNVDSIAANGVRFTNGYVSCPVCSPTRAGLMTGRYQQRFGHEFNPGPNAADNFGLPLDQVTLPQTLKAAGYATGMIGKWHLGFKPEMVPTSRGFDEFFGFLGGAHVYNNVGQGKNALMRGTKPVDDTDYLTDAFAREACAFIDRHAAGDKPFFLYLPFNAIHNPQQAPRKYLDRFPHEKDEKRQLMLAMLSAMDDAVGQVLQHVRDHKLEESTLIYFTSDNGGPTGGNGSRNDPLRGFKGDVFEGGIHLPQMVQWKGHIPAGKTYDKPVISLDIFPTLCSAAGVKPPENLDGVNLLPYLTGDNAGAPHQTLYWRFGPQWAIRDGDLKLCGTRNGETMLFDLAKDISESHDLASAQTETVKRLHGLFNKWNAELAAPKWSNSRNLRATSRGQRRARMQRSDPQDE